MEVRPPGTLVISLDFELHWGMHDKWSVDEYRSHLEGVPAAVDGMLRLFERHEIAATWAIVGLLWCKGREDALAHAPEPPGYTNPRQNPYALLGRCGIDESADPMHFAPSLVARIAQGQRQEIGTHTFSHYYALEAGQTARQFDADLGSAGVIARRSGVNLRSIVFPRNQVSDEYLSVCRRHGLIAYRPNRQTWMQSPRAGTEEKPLRRAARLLDTCVPLEADVVRPWVDRSGMVAVPASRQLQPLGRRHSPLELLQLRRVLAGMRHAAATGAVYHLWWHPHNFGAAVGRNLEQLEVVLRHHTLLRARYGMRSETMHKVAAGLLASNAA